MDYYEEAAGRQLADEFYSELRVFLQKAADSPEAYDYSRARPETRQSRKISLSLSVPNRPRPSPDTSRQTPP